MRARDTARGYDECMAFQLIIDKFSESGPVPKRYTCDGEDISPALAWSGEPVGTRSFALIMDDPDAPLRTWNHWLLWDIPRGTHALEERFEPGSTGQSGTNDFGKPGYGGPCPPQGDKPHRYVFKVYALKTDKLDLDESASGALVGYMLNANKLGKASFTATYGH